MAGCEGFHPVSWLVVKDSPLFVTGCERFAPVLWLVVVRPCFVAGCGSPLFLAVCERFSTARGWLRGVFRVAEPAFSLTVKGTVLLFLPPTGVATIIISPILLLLCVRVLPCHRPLGSLLSEGGQWDL